MEGSNFQITDNLTDNFTSAIASNGSIYLVVWARNTSEGSDIYGARFHQDGVVFDEDENGFLICSASNDQLFPAVISDGENFFVAWQDRRSGKRWDIHGAMVTSENMPEGHVFPLDGKPITEGKSTYDQVAPALSYDGENFFVVWHGKRTAKIWNVYFGRVSKNGEVIDNAPTIVNPSPKNQASPAVAFDGENYLIVWQDFRSGKFWDIYGAMVSPFGEVLDLQGDRKAIQISPNGENASGWNQWRPVVSWNGSSFLVIWMASKEENKWYLEGKTIDVSGNPDIDNSIQMGATNKIFPSIIWGGEEYLIVWEEEPEGESRIYWTSIIPEFISEGSSVSSVDPVDPSFPRDPSFPKISRIKDNGLIIWQAKDYSDHWQIYSQRIRKKVLPIGPR